MKVANRTRTSRVVVGATMLLSVIAVLGTATAVSALPKPAMSAAAR